MFKKISSLRVKRISPNEKESFYRKTFTISKLCLSGTTTTTTTYQIRSGKGTTHYIYYLYIAFLPWLCQNLEFIEMTYELRSTQ